MKRITSVLVLIVSGLCGALAAQTPEELYNQALIQERAAGNLPEAIRLFQRVAKESSGDRALAVQALMNAAVAYEKLGQSDASRTVYKEIVQAFPEQREQVATANQHLAETGIVQGTVARAGTGEPIAEARITLSGGPLNPDAFSALQTFFKIRGVDVTPPPNGVADDRFFQSLADAAAARNISLNNPAARAMLTQFRASNSSRFTAETDNLGHYTIRNVPPGQYALISEREGFFPASDAAENMTTVAAGRTAVVDAAMSRGATVSGKITDAAGQPLPNVSVQAFSIQYQGGFPILQPAVSKTTDDQGEYRLFWLTPGEYLIAATPEGSLGAQALQSNIINVRQAAAPAAIGPPPPTAGSPRPPRAYYPSTPDVSMAVPVFVRGEAPVSGIDIQVRRIPLLHIKGEVRSNILSTAPTPPQTVDATLDIRPRSSAAPDDLGAPTLGVTLHLSGNQYVGEFDFNNILPGAYTMTAWVGSPPGPAGAGAAARGVRGIAHTDVDVSNTDVTGVTFDIYPNPSVNGILTVNGAAPAQTTARISLQADGALAKKGVYQGIATRPVLPDSQTGAFTIADVLSGSFRVQVGSGLPSDIYLADVRQGGVSVFDSGFEVNRDNSAPLQVLLRSGARTVEGTVRDRAGKPVSGVTAVLGPPRERRQNRALYYTAKTDASGHFRIEGVAPGNYALFSWQNMPDGAYFNDRFVSRNEDAGRKINAVQSSVTGADITLIPTIGR
jgi:protocatechuate 3,4-dioxygenase beta subunit